MSELKETTTEDLRAYGIRIDEERPGETSVLKHLLSRVRAHGLARLTVSEVPRALAAVRRRDERIRDLEEQVAALSSQLSPRRRWWQRAS